MTPTFDRMMEDNFKTVWMACQEVGRVMLQRGGGVIVNISNVMAERGVPNATLYCAAKGAVRNLVRALALEWARQGYSHQLVECGWLDEAGSPAKQAATNSAEKLVKYLPYRRLLKPEEIAGALHLPGLARRRLCDRRVGRRRRRPALPRLIGPVALQPPRSFPDD